MISRLRIRFDRKRVSWKNNNFKVSRTALSKNVLLNATVQALYSLWERANKQSRKESGDACEMDFVSDWYVLFVKSVGDFGMRGFFRTGWTTPSDCTARIVVHLEDYLKGNLVECLLEFTPLVCIPFVRSSDCVF